MRHVVAWKKAVVLEAEFVGLMRGPPFPATLRQKPQGGGHRLVVLVDAQVACLAWAMRNGTWSSGSIMGHNPFRRRGPNMASSLSVAGISRSL